MCCMTQFLGHVVLYNTVTGALVYVMYGTVAEPGALYGTVPGVHVYWN